MASPILNLSSGLGAGPSKCTPVILKPLPWHGHLNFDSTGNQFGVHPRCVHTVDKAKIDSSSLTIHALKDFLNLISTEFFEKSYGNPILNVCGGSNSTFGNRKRTMIVKNPPVTPR